MSCRKFILRHFHTHYTGMSSSLQASLREGNRKKSRTSIWFITWEVIQCTHLTCLDLCLIWHKLTLTPNGQMQNIISNLRGLFFNTNRWKNLLRCLCAILKCIYPLIICLSVMRVILLSQNIKNCTIFI